MNPYKKAADKMLERRAQWEVFTGERPVCAGCGERLENGAVAYGLTLGLVDYSTMHGFAPDNASPWESVWHLGCYIDLDETGGFIIPDGPFEGKRAYFTKRGLDKMLGDEPDDGTTTHGGITVHRVSNLRDRLRAAKEEGAEIKIGGTS